MKNLLLSLLFLLIAGNAMAKKDKELKEPFIGSWKFANQSAVNDFRKNEESRLQKCCHSEYFIFETDHTFRHEFLDETGAVVKKLTGKWKTVGDKIKIEYADIDFSLMINYFFLDKDLVLGQNFSHVIFTKDVLDDKNIAIK